MWKQEEQESNPSEFVEMSMLEIDCYLMRGGIKRNHRWRHKNVVILKLTKVNISIVFNYPKNIDT